MIGRSVDRSLGLSVSQFVVGDSIPCNLMTTLPTSSKAIIRESGRWKKKKKEKESAKEHAEHMLYSKN
jgi:hypothetical protein